MKKLLFYLSLVLHTIFAGNVKGVIVDEIDNTPLFGANVLLSNLGVGSSTNVNGEFTFLNMSKGEYDLEISIIGYETYRKSFIIKSDEDKELFILLNREPIIWEAINVVGMFPSKHSPEITQIIDSKTLLQKNSSSLSSLLKSIHGFDLQMAHVHGRNVNISIRGSSDYKPGGYNNRVLLLIDGFPVSIPNSGAPDWNAIPLENIDRVEIVRGPASSLYGHNSMGGVINMVTKSNIPNKLLSFDAGVGSFNNNIINVNYSHDIKNIKVFTSAGYNYSKGHRFNANYNNIKGSLKLKSKLNNQAKWSLSTIITKSKNGQPGFIYPDNPGLISYRKSERVSSYLQLFYSLPIFDNGLLSSSIGLNQFHTIYDNRDDTPIEKIQEETTYNDQMIMLRSEYQHFLNDKSIIIVGAEFGNDQSKADVINSIYSQPMQRTIAAFSQLKKNINTLWKMDVGIRYDYRWVQGGKNYPKKLFQSFSPKFNIYFQSTPDKQYHLSLNRGFRAPSISELFLEHESSYGLQFRGNSGLKPEYLTAAEIGFKSHYNQSQTWFTNLFYNYYSDMIDFVYSIPVESLNRTNVESYGFEIGGNFNLPNNVARLEISYSYLEMEDLKNQDIPILYRSNHKIKGSIYKRIFKDIDLSFLFNYKSSQLYEDFLSDDHPIVDNIFRFPIKRISDTSLFDLQLSKSFTDYKITGTVRNIFNTEYVLIQHYPMPGRTWQINFSKQLNR
tara:strand:+ start:1626 stop:3803 length:2178 start_codon:yes stop_codon:yes gene_type:complete